MVSEKILKDVDKMEAMIDDKLPEVKQEKKLSVLDEATAISRKLEEQMSQYRDLLNRQEEIMARRMLQGESYAGQEAQKKPEEIAKKEAAIDFWKGSPVADAIKKHG